MNETQIKINRLTKAAQSALRHGNKERAKQIRLEIFKLMLISQTRIKP